MIIYIERAGANTSRLRAEILDSLSHAIERFDIDSDEDQRFVLIEDTELGSVFDSEQVRALSNIRRAEERSEVAYRMPDGRTVYVECAPSEQPDLRAYLERVGRLAG